MIDKIHLDTLREYLRPPSTTRGPMHDAVSAVLDDHHQRVAKGLPPDAPVPMILDCPFCHTQHVDEGRMATTPHRTHACQHCGRLWAPAVVATVGVRFLPGCRDDEERVADASPEAILPGHHADCKIDMGFSWLPVHCVSGCSLNPLSRPCPTCGAGAGIQCRSFNAPPSCTVGDFRPDFHEARRRRGPLARDQAVKLLHDHIVATGQREREPPEWAIRAVLAASGAVEQH